MMMPMGGTHAALPVEEKVTEAVNSASKDGLRALKVVVEGGKLPALVGKDHIKASDSMEKDFEAIVEVLDDDIPCLVLVRLLDDGKAVAGAHEDSWALLAWTPDSAPVKSKMTCTSSRRTIKDHFKTLSFKEYNAREKAEVTLAEFVAATKSLSEQERLEAMSQDEILAYEAKKLSAEEQFAAPKMLTGLAAVQVKAQPSWDAAIESMLKEKDRVAVLGKVESESLVAEVLSDVLSPAKLRGRLPKEEPCYVVMPVGVKKLLFLTWLPEGSQAKQRMTYSTFKRSVVQLLEAAASDHTTILNKQAADDEDLNDTLGIDMPVVAPKAPQPAPKSGGFKPPPGSFALPGMGPKS